MIRKRKPAWRLRMAKPVTSKLKQYRQRGERLDPEDALCELRDPALVLAREILCYALAAIPEYEQVLNKPGQFVIIKTPSADWTKLIQMAWREIIQHGLASVDGSQTSCWSNESWACFVVPDEDRRQQRSRFDQADLVEEAAWRGRSLVGFAPDPASLLPRALLSAADHVFIVREPRDEDLAETLLLLTGERPSVPWKFLRLNTLRPSLVRQARRQNQSADDFITKLSGLIDIEQAQEASVVNQPPEPTASRKSVRDEPTLDRLHGLDEAVAWGRSLQLSLQEYSAGRLAWADVESGCLLSGSPGIGKTLFARALAATCSIPLFSAGYSVWFANGHGHQGGLLKAMKATFADAKKAKPSIVFIDELDSFHPRRGGTDHQKWNSEIVNALLAEIDGTEGRDGVVVLGASNFPQDVDPALIRSGRIERHIWLCLPDQLALAKIIREHLGADLPDTPLSSLALTAAGATGADCELFVKAARRRAREARRPLQLIDLLSEIRGTDDRTEQQLRTVSVHEAGHALVITELFPGALTAVTIRAGSDGAGRVLSALDGPYTSAESTKSQLACLLAGRAAEEIVLGKPTSAAGGGPTSDLGMATWLAARAVVSYGLDDATGLVWSGPSERAKLEEMILTNAKLASRVSEMLDSAYQVALLLLRRRKGAVMALSEAIHERWALNSSDVKKILDRYSRQTFVGELV